jgi:methylthioribose-1-phosphate isomerase
VRPVQSVGWSADRRALRILDQRLLPGEVRYRDIASIEVLCEAIVTLAVRGAPAIGVAAAIGIAVAARATPHSDFPAFRRWLETTLPHVRSTRPTAVNLAWALERLSRAASAATSVEAAVGVLELEAQRILDEDRAMCEQIGRHGMLLLPPNARVLTHCNAGALATAGIGTALAPVYCAAAEGSIARVYACETRPLLQGSRLTAWELSRAGIPVTVITDGMAAALMARGDVDVCLVGADRIARNGDVANKIGTYALAIAARQHNIPFYVAAPSSTIDATTVSGRTIPIEERSAVEITRVVGEFPDGIDVWNPAFDVTPCAFVTAIISDAGVHRPPFDFAA